VVKAALRKWELAEVVESSRPSSRGQATGHTMTRERCGRHRDRRQEI